MPDAPGLELIAAELGRAHPGSVLATSFDREQPALIVDPEQVLAVLTWLRETPGQEYGFLASLHAADYLPATPRFAVHYELLNRNRVERLRVKAPLADPADPSSAPPGGADQLPPPSVTPGSTDPADRPSAFPDRADQAAPGTGSAGGANLGDRPSAPAAATTGLPEIDSCVDLFPTANFQEREAYDFFGIVFRGHPDLTRILMPEDYVGWPQRRDFPVGGEPVLFTRNERTSPGWWK